jgi:hypothetical protein
MRVTALDIQFAALASYRQTHAETLTALRVQLARLQDIVNRTVVQGGVEITKREDDIVQALVYEYGDIRLSDARIHALCNAGILTERPYDHHVFKPEDVAACLDPSVRPLWERTNDSETLDEA